MEDQALRHVADERESGLRIRSDSLETLEVSGNTATTEPGKDTANPPGLETLDPNDFLAVARAKRAAMSLPERLLAQARVCEAHNLKEDAVDLREAAALLSPTDINYRLFNALQDAGRSALGFPGTVDTFKAMLNDAGLALVLAPKGGK